MTSDDVDSSLYDHYQAFYIYNPSYNLYFLLQGYLHYHNNANILSLGARFLKKQKMFDIIQIWLSESFEGGRHQRRIDKLDTES